MNCKLLPNVSIDKILDSCFRRNDMLFLFGVDDPIVF